MTRTLSGKSNRTSAAASARRGTRVDHESDGRAAADSHSPSPAYPEVSAGWPLSGWLSRPAVAASGSNSRLRPGRSTRALRRRQWVLDPRLGLLTDNAQYMRQALAGARSGGASSTEAASTEAAGAS